MSARVEYAFVRLDICKDLRVSGEGPNLAIIVRVENPLLWRYCRDQEILYVTAQLQTDAGYVLVCRFPDGQSRAERLGTLAVLYEYLQTLEAQLGADGWELLPVDQRAPNRLRTPTCEECPVDQHVDVITRTKSHVHFRCAGCGHVWVVPKPGVPLTH